MARAALRSASVASVALMVLPPCALAQQIRLGHEFQVSTYTVNEEVYPALAAKANGDFVVVWQSPPPGPPYGIFFRRYSSAGVALGAELRADVFAGAGDPMEPSVALGAGGDFIVTWTSFGQDGSGRGVFARRFSSAGVAQAGEFQVNAVTSFDQTYPSVAAAAGGFVIAWASEGQDGGSDGVFARRFSSAGTPLGAELQVSTFTVDIQTAPAVSGEGDGDFVVAWDSFLQDGAYMGVFARRFSSAGAASGAEFQVNSHTIDVQAGPSVAADADGDFVVAWRSHAQDGDDYGVFARRFSSAGTPLGAEFRVNDYATEGQSQPSIAAAADGDFVVVWRSFGQDGDQVGIFGRRFSGAGTPLALEFQVTAYTQHGQRYPAVASDAGGDFVVAWQSAYQDGSLQGVFAQRFAILVVMDVDGDGSSTPLTDGLLMLRYLFGFRGAVLISGAVNLAGCTRCDAPAIEAYIAGLNG